MVHRGSRLVWLLISLFSFSVVGIALVSQHYFDMMPCAWCIFQRLIFITIGAWAFLGFIFNPKGGGLFVFATASMLFAIGGFISALHQHYVAATSVSCDLTLADKVISASGLDESFPNIFAVYGSCADAAVDLLGVKYDIWAAIGFVIIFVLSVFALTRNKRRSHFR